MEEEFYVHYIETCGGPTHICIPLKDFFSSGNVLSANCFHATDIIYRFKQKIKKNVHPTVGRNLIGVLPAALTAVRMFS